MYFVGPTWEDQGYLTLPEDSIAAKLLFVDRISSSRIPFYEKDPDGIVVFRSGNPSAILIEGDRFIMPCNLTNIAELDTDFFTLLTDANNYMPKVVYAKDGLINVPGEVERLLCLLERLPLRYIVHNPNTDVSFMKHWVAEYENGRDEKKVEFIAHDLCSVNNIYAFSYPEYVGLICLNTDSKYGVALVNLKGVVNVCLSA